MTTMVTLLFAAVASASMQCSPTEALVQESHLRDLMMRSELANLSKEEQAAILVEHTRVRADLEAMFGFPWGQAFTNYAFRAVVTNANTAQQSIYALPKNALGFTEFRPLVTEDTLYGISLRRPIDGLFSESAFQAAEDEARTNLCAGLGLQLEDILRSTNGVKHAWRISFENWNQALAIRISDEELVVALMQAANERRRAARAVAKEIEK